MAEAWGASGNPVGSAVAIGFCLDARAGAARGAPHARRKAFQAMKPSAIFINTGRGPTVDEEGLIKALQEGWIAHAALDVLEKEPPSHNNPLLGMENVTLTAHVASASARFDEARKRRVGYELSLVLSGMWPMSCVNPAVLQNTSLRRWQPAGMDRGPEQLSAVSLLNSTARKRGALQRPLEPLRARACPGLDPASKPRVRKTRQNKKLEPGSDSIKTGRPLGQPSLEARRDPIKKGPKF